MTLSDGVGRWLLPGWPALDATRSTFQNLFAARLRDEPAARGRVLDIGCGPKVPLALRPVTSVFGSLDGVDADPAIVKHPLLAHRWQSEFETAPLPEHAYDLAYAYNVLEHVVDPVPFFAKVSAVLKPGGVFWALAPNARHPFAMLSRVVDVGGLRPFAQRQLLKRPTQAMFLGDSRAYYRCNSPAAIRRAIATLDFAGAEFEPVMSVQWDRYFPAWLRWAPHVWDCHVSARAPSMRLLLMVRLQKQS